MITKTRMQAGKSATGRFYALFAGLALVVIGLGVATFVRGYAVTTIPSEINSPSSIAAIHSQQVEGVSALQIADESFLIAIDADMSGRLLALDHGTKALRKVADLGCNAIARMSSDRQTAYIFDQDPPQLMAWTGGLYAIDVKDGKRVWDVAIPGIPFGPVNSGMWTSVNGELLYLQGSRDGTNPHIFVVDIVTHRLIRDFEIPLPYPPTMDNAFPAIWKMPQSEALIVASRDKIFTVDLETGVASAASELFSADSIVRIPSDLPWSPYVMAGLISADGSRLWLATSTQEILQVNLEEKGLTVSRVVALPEGWRFATVKPIAADAHSGRLYIATTDSVHADRIKQIWQYDTTSWSQVTTEAVTTDSLSAGQHYGIEADAISGNIRLYGSTQILTIGNKAKSVKQADGVSLSAAPTDGSEAPLDPAHTLYYVFLN
ncbi:MAG: hypothetical protein KatS3mg053_2272 [Candidatus Roseilinea sp.]|nr:MAG: hypothetical protein KatS3mg053_2272 [Candidatus Roseilinea sp.]